MNFLHSVKPERFRYGAANTSIDDPLAGERACEFYNSVVNGPSTSSSPVEYVPSRRAAPPIARRRSSRQMGARRSFTAEDIFKATQEGDLRTIREFINSGGNPDLKDQYGWSLLMIAACGNWLEMVEFLCEAGASKNTRNPQGQTALVLAAMKELTEVVFYLRGSRQETIQPEERETNHEDGDSMRHRHWCELCQTWCSEGQRRHETSILHQVSVPRPPQPTTYHIPCHNKGYQLLVQGGWNREQGLGPPGQSGNKFPVKTILKHDRRGLGHKNTSKPRITHFDPFDASAVKSPYIKHLPQNISTKKDILRREAKMKRKERRIRRELS